MGHHEHERRETKYGALDPKETEKLLKEAKLAGPTSVGYFLQQAANCETQSERVFWLNKVDGARYMEARQDAKDELDASARRNMEADLRLEGTEAYVTVDRVVGNACVLKLQKGIKEPEGGYSLVRRIAGRTGLESYGGPHYGNSWVPQGLQMDQVHEFAVVSSDDQTAKEVTGPWIRVPIGNVSTDEINKAEYEEAQEQYRQREAEEDRKQREYSQKVAQRRKEQAEALKRQQAQADIDNARREEERIQREEAHKKAVAELHLVAPRELSFRLRDLKKAGMVCDIEFKRGIKKCDIYQFKVDGTVLGYYPDGRHSGRKSENHVYTRTVTVPRGRDVEIHVYGVTPHGDAGDPVVLPIPQTLCKEEPSRIDQIIAAMETFEGRRTRKGKPYVRDLRKHANMSDITVKERNVAFKKLNRD